MLRHWLCGTFLLAVLLAPVAYAQTTSTTLPADQSKTTAGNTQTTTDATTNPPLATTEVIKAAFIMFLLAVVLESALALIFNWRPFVETFNARALRPLVSFAAAYFVVETFQIDLMTTIVNAAATAPSAPSTTGKVLTAMVIAGGSAGVNNLLVALGYRQRRTPETVTPKPPPDKAWLAVRLTRQSAVGPVNVFIGVLSARSPPIIPIVGIIHGTSKAGLRYFLNDPGRFPGHGGHQVAANSEVTVSVAGVDANGVAITETWGPHTIAGGAVIDLDLKL